jgi:hypothetical protein
VWFIHAECNLHTYCDFDTHECDYDTHDCDFKTHKSVLYTQSVILARMSVILTLTRVITTRTSVISNFLNLQLRNMINIFLISGTSGFNSFFGSIFQKKNKSYKIINFLSIPKTKRTHHLVELLFCGHLNISWMK